ncbi:glycoside hydrolase N-terminal domain-containing protein [Paenibacillus sp. GD4]|uniref:glycosyl hydrolase family 95 catalytic domain-containing protein n=1 Tax=Paenibacillus sp. GD4 TaxID=3068890 RepID=UPI0027964096|nr:glycoside hydrolase N-terminal domain-containing protein [Paenibacillus sp. GD4]MDQ1914818.1 glycoside hydrolase N-terminal domain-containing protein [Paenibacillus sp. GD4]
MRSITFDNATCGWNEALPLGNGHFGGMVFFEEHRLSIALNHYEVYYQKLNRYSKKYRAGEGPDLSRQYGYTFEELKEHATDLYRDPGGGPIYLYGDALNPNSMFRKYGKPAGGSSHYPTGEIHLHPSAVLAEPDHYSLQLDMDTATVHFRTEKAGNKLDVKTIVSQDGDYVITKIRQSNASLLESIDLTVPSRRYAEMDVVYHQLNDTAFYYQGSFYPDGEDRERFEPFRFIVMMRLVGANGAVEALDDSIRIRPLDAKEDITLLTTVVTEEVTKDLLAEAVRRLNTAVERVEEMMADHQEHWRSFWQRSSITVPDKMIEDLWHLNLYALACCSGQGGNMREQACGLNGLWDIKQPTKWGSMWYWDVNIQAAFAPLYTANRLEIAEVFTDGLLSYTGLAERMAQQFYGLKGISADYPHALYMSIWPWCAQFLWDYYRYSMDMDFLREKAYRVFKGLAQFFEGYLQMDAHSGRLCVFPDISPEQGPITRNSTCSLAAIKYLLNIACEANELLGESEADRRRWKEMAELLTDYPSGEAPGYGEIWLDSEWAPAELHLRHPSLLMPIYPVGEFNKNSEPPQRKRAENTLRYVENHIEYGVFQFGWLSCAAARLGKGNTALRLLYEHGIDLSLRSNGLFAEETERWMNYCNITNEPLYHPHMTEGSGGIVAAVNEMLLQSYDGVIDVFPAVPSGESEPERTVGMYEHHLEHKVRSYERWENCAFHGLLAVGGFEVSAEMRDGRTVWVRMKSRAGGRITIRNPFGRDEKIIAVHIEGAERSEIEYSLEDDLISFLTKPYGEYAIYPQAVSDSLLSYNPQPIEGEGYPRTHEAHTFRRVFLGKNKDTQYYRMLDHFTFDYYAGNSRESRLAAFRLDCGVNPAILDKDYRNVLPRQVHKEGILGQTFRKITTETVFTPYSGIGWLRAEKLISLDRGNPDELRRDFIGGAEEATFIIELPKGRYDLLFVTGDSAVPSYTEIGIPGQSAWKPEKALRAGEFHTDILTISQKQDGFLNIHFRSMADLQWRVNVLVINKSYTYL